MVKNKKINMILDIIRNSSFFILIFIGINILLTSVLFLCHISISYINILLSVILTIVFINIFYKSQKNKHVIISSIIAIGVLIVSIFVCSYTYDTTWDGNTYHKLAVGMLKDGWNPVYQSAESYINDDVKNVGLINDGRNSIWIEHYPKASWIFAANIYSVTNNIESSKVITILIMYVTFSLMLSYLHKKTNIVYSTIISLLICINPISIVQVFSYYIDGLMGLCIYMIIYALIALSDKSIKNEENADFYEKQNWLILTISLLICINLKFTGLVYSAIFCFIFYILWIYRGYKEGNIKNTIIKYTSYYIVVVLISLCVVGFSPYIKNLTNKGNPLYPLIGKNKVDIMTYNQPKSFTQRGAFDKFFTSIFGVAENVKSNSTDKDPALKIPFSITNGEIQQFAKPDLRISGFGVWFSGIFIITIFTLIFLLYRLYKRKEFECLGMLIAFVLVSILLVMITDGSWWARYVPYIYLLPIITIVLLVNEKNKKYNILAIGLCILLTINVGIIVHTSFKHTLTEYVRIEQEMHRVKKINKKNGIVKISLRTDGFPSALYNLRDKYINVELNNRKHLKSPRYANYFYYESKQ